jgi:hypothetical protein
MIEKIITYKKQGDGRDTWVVKEYEDGVLINSYMVDKLPEGYADTLQEAMTIKKDLIDKRTSELINEGIVFKGVLLSMSKEAQTNYLGLPKVRPEKFPLPFMSKDDTKVAMVLNEADAEDLYYLAWDKISSEKMSGGSLKMQVNSLTTIEEVLNFVDPR